MDFLVRRYGRDAMVRLIRSYASGVTDAEAFQGALGVDDAGFAAAWLAFTPGFVLATNRFNNDAAAFGWSALTLLARSATVRPPKQRSSHCARKVVSAKV